MPHPVDAAGRQRLYPPSARRGTSDPKGPWTPEKINQLRALWADNSLSEREIGRRLGGLSKNAVSGKALRLNLGERPGRAKALLPPLIDRHPVQPPLPKPPPTPRGRSTLPPLPSLLLPLPVVTLGTLESEVDADAD